MLVSAQTIDGLDGGPAYLTVKHGGTWFSYTRKGDSIYFHIKSDSPRTFEDSAKWFIDWAFCGHDWCKMLLITTKRRSIKRIAARLGFVEFLTNGDICAMMRLRDG